MRMRRALPILLFALVTGAACAGPRLHRALAERTENYVINQPIAKVWPVAQQLLQDHHVPGTSSPGLYHLETPVLTRNGQLPAASSQSSSAPAGQGQGGGRGGGRRGSKSPASDRSGGEVRRFVVDGDAVDDAHCTVHIVRFSRDNVDSPESAERDAELEWELVSRVEPERAAVIRKELAASGIQVPP
jgi:hypothetical protein